MKRVPWSLTDDGVLVASYADVLTQTIADQLGRTASAVYQRATKLGLGKSAAFFSGNESGRLTTLTATGNHHHFPKGQIPWNKGIKGSTGLHPNCRRTQFTKGRQHNNTWRPLGTYELNKDGALEVKVSGSSTRRERWKAVSRVVWETANGPVPDGYVVVFKRGQQTAELALITLDRIELITRAENMRRNSYHNFPQPIPQLIQLKGALMRQINKRERA